MGKGRNAWFCYGYFIASDRSEALALHDADIVTYNRSMLARLFYPLADPRFNYKFCKGFYDRESEKQLKGRVTRLLVFPLIRSLEQFFGHVPFLRFLDGFRYPLAGEHFLYNPMQADFIPSWKRVMSAIPDFMDQFYEAVELDNKD